MTRILLALLLLLSPIPAQSRNLAAAALDHAECQFESRQQRQAIIVVLYDILTLPTPTLRARRYPDYAGKPGQWTAPETLHHYCVPARAVATDADRFYHDRLQPAGRRAIRSLLRTLHEPAD